MGEDYKSGAQGRVSAIAGINQYYQERASTGLLNCGALETLRCSTLKLSKADIKYCLETVNVELGMWECEEERKWKPIKRRIALNIYTMNS